MANQKQKQPVYEDAVGCQAALFEWAESYDTKDWSRLSEQIGRGVLLTDANLWKIDYRTVMNQLWEVMPAEQFLGMASSEKFLGNPRIKTQHLIGAGKLTQTSDDEITGFHQMRVAHQKYKDDEMTEVLHKGHAHGKATVWFRRVDGTWKFAGLRPDIRWAEHDVDKIFQDE